MKRAAIPTLAFLLGGLLVALWMGRGSNDSRVVISELPRSDHHHRCDLTSNERIAALVEALSGSPAATNSFIELGGNCPDDVGMFQIVAAIELGFPRDSNRRAAAAGNLVASTPLISPESQDAQHLALALALLAFSERLCGSTEALEKRFTAIGFNSEIVKTALSESMKRRGGETIGCAHLARES